MAEKNKTKKKKVFVDDGHTVYNMDGVGQPSVDVKNNIGLSKKEKRAAIRAAYATYLPIIIGFGVCFFGAMLICSCWLGQ